MSDREVNVKLSAHAGEFSAGLKAALGDFDKFSRSIIDGKNLMFVAGAAATTLGAAIIRLAVKTAETGDKLLEMSEQTGISVEQLSLLRFAAEQSNTNIEVLALGLRALSKNMLEASDGAGGQAALFRAMGVDVKDAATGALRPMNDVLLDIADVFKVMGPSTEAAALAQKLFGKSGQELISLLIQGKITIEEYMVKAREMGLFWSTEAAKSADQFNDQVREMNSRFKAMGEIMGKEVLPVLNKVLEGFNERLSDEGIFAAILNLTPLGALTHTMAAGFNALTGRIDETSAATNSLTIATDHAALSSEEAAQFIKAEAEALKVKIAQQLNAPAIAKAAAKAAMDAAKQEAEGREIVQKSLERYLDMKRTMMDFDADYFQALHAQLVLQGYTNEQTQAKIAEDVYKNRSKAKGYDKDYTDDVIAEKNRETAALKAAEQRFLEDYKLQQGNQVTAAKETDDLIVFAAQGMGDSIKGILHDQEATFKDVWQRTLGNIVDILAIMVAQALGASVTISVAMATATAGISLVIGLLAAMFSKGKGGGPSEIQKATQAFLDEMDKTIRDFEDQILSSFERIRRGIEDGRADLTELRFIMQEIALRSSGATWADLMAPRAEAGQQHLAAVNMDTLMQGIIDKSEDVKDAIASQYELEMSLINDVMDLIGQARDFAKDIDETITDVVRATFSPEELFAAQQQDVQALLSQLIGSTGEDRLAIVEDLKQAYLQVWESAQNLFEADPQQLAQWQTYVLQGLAGVRDAGLTAYDQLIQINLDALGVEREGNDLMRQMISLQELMEASVLGAYQTLQEIVNNPGDTALVSRLGELLTTLGFKHGGYGDFGSGTLAMLHGQEVIAPLDRFMEIAGVGLGGGGGTYHFHFPNITSIDQLTVPQLEKMLKTNLGQAARNLGANGHTWPMKTSAKAR